LYGPDLAKDTTNLTLTLHLKTQDLAGLALGKHLKWATTDLAIGREALGCDACVDHKLKTLATKWALNGFGYFHVTRQVYVTFVAAECVLHCAD
jgi:hypothetical protein